MRTSQRALCSLLLVLIPGVLHAQGTWIELDNKESEDGCPIRPTSQVENPAPQLSKDVSPALAKNKHIGKSTKIFVYKPEQAVKPIRRDIRCDDPAPFGGRARSTLRATFEVNAKEASNLSKPIMVAFALKPPFLSADELHFFPLIDTQGSHYVVGDVHVTVLSGSPDERGRQQFDVDYRIPATDAFDDWLNQHFKTPGWEIKHRSFVWRQSRGRVTTRLEKGGRFSFGGLHTSSMPGAMYMPPDRESCNASFFYPLPDHSYCDTVRINLRKTHYKKRKSR